MVWKHLKNQKKFFSSEPYPTNKTVVTCGIPQGSILGTFSYYM